MIEQISDDRLLFRLHELTRTDSIVSPDSTIVSPDSIVVSPEEAKWNRMHVVYSLFSSRNSTNGEVEISESASRLINMPVSALTSEILSFEY